MILMSRCCSCVYSPRPQSQISVLTLLHIDFRPELNHDAVTEILLRLPPDEPACLVHAALVCKPWHRILKDPAFTRRYREFHRTPPLLGFLHSTYNKDLKCTIPRFVPTTTTPPFPNPPPDCYNSLVEDCRHGRVLLLGPLV
ncbi:hypothetical protein EJB05_14249, partial [Eragrostis curvula]